jgi:protein TIF31
MERHFRFTLPDSWRQLRCLNNLDRVAMLRNFCLKIGLQLVARSYQFVDGTRPPFDVADVAGFFPVVKLLEPDSTDGHDLLETGIAHVADGKMDVAFELLSEALNVFSQIYGPMHPYTAVCFSSMALLLNNAGEAAEAATYQRKAVIINERVQGLDHHETAQAYGNLGLFYQKMGQPRLALSYVMRAAFLGLVSCGSQHPDNASAFVNIGLLLQELGELSKSLDYFLRALAVVPTSTVKRTNNKEQQKKQREDQEQNAQENEWILLQAAM